MTKLHELLAVEGNLENQAVKLATDLAATFEKKRHLFEEKRTVFTPNTEGAQPEVKIESDLQTTVPGQLNELSDYVAKAWDASFQVAVANTQAVADIVLDDGTKIAEKVPATALLELEKKLVDFQKVLGSVPTLDPAKGFQPEPSRGDYVFKARDVHKTRTKKDVRVIVKYEATKEHPAQTELRDFDAPIGTVAEQEWSGLITPAAKTALLSRCESVYRAVRQARARANEVEVDQKRKIGKALLDQILAPKS
jgi:hypothetical protein